MSTTAGGSAVRIGAATLGLLIGVALAPAPALAGSGWQPWRPQVLTANMLFAA